MFIAFTLIILSFKDTWVISDLDIYHPIGANWVSVSEDLHLYIADVQDRKILHYDPNRTFLGKIGTRGQGPGALSIIAGLSFFDQKLYVLDSMERRIQVFDKNGKFIKTLRTPAIGIMSGDIIKRVRGGWVYIDKPNGRLVWRDENFENPKILFQIRNEFMNQGNLGRRIYTPAKERILMDSKPDGSAFFAYFPGHDFTIFHYDGNTGDLLSKIKKNYPRLPFDQDWGEQRFAAFKERNAHKAWKRGTTYEKRFPEFFPAIYDLHYDPDGFLRIRRGNVFFQPDQSFVALGLNGDEVDDYLPDERFRKILAYTNDWVFVAQPVSSSSDDKQNIVRLAWDTFRKDNR